jgi:glycosyltransferase involved in cell wall biosynthesis
MAEPLRVLHVIEPGCHGVFRYVEGLIQFQLRQNVQIHLAYSSVRGSEGLTQLVQRAAAAGGNTLDLRVSNAPHPRDLSALVKLLQLATNTRPDVVHSHSSKAGVLGRTLALCGVPAKYFYAPYAYYGMDGSGNLRWLYHGLERFFGRIGTTLHISADEAHFSQEEIRLTPGRQETLYNPVDVERFLPASPVQRSAARRKWGIPEDAILLGTAARMGRQKDPHTLYAALIPLMESNPRLHFLHVGRAGEYPQAISARVESSQAKDRVWFVDYLDDMRAFYEALDGFVLSSRFEAGIPFVLLEAFAMNLPVATTAFAGGSQLPSLHLSHCGIAPKENANALRKVIEQLIVNLPSARPINHRAVARAHFGTESCYRRILDLYRG